MTANVPATALGRVITRRIMEPMGVLARLGALSRRWDTPQMPWWQRRQYIPVMLGWLVAAGAGIYSLMVWKFGPGPQFFVGAFTAASLGPTLRHRHEVRHAAATSLRPADAGNTRERPAG